MTTSTSGVLDVPGAHLHHTVHGSGPVLLTIPGGAADGGMFAALAATLSAVRTVVTYDPRGLSASTVDDPTAPITVAGQADDAAALIDAVLLDVGADGPVDVLASSGGALTGLDLAARHPGRVRTLVAHEPPLTHLLPDAPDDGHDEILDLYRRAGAGPAMMLFLETIGVFGDGPVPPMAVMAPMVPNFDVFFGRMWTPLGAFRPDVEALRRSGVRIVVAGGTTSVGQPAERAAAAFADLLGVPLTPMPGDHGGFAAEPEAFAAALLRVLDQRPLTRSAPAVPAG